MPEYLAARFAGTQLQADQKVRQRENKGPEIEGGYGSVSCLKNMGNGQSNEVGWYIYG